MVVLASLALGGCGGSGGTGESRSATIISHTGRPARGLHVDGSIPLRRSGTGSETLGTFQIHGWLVLRATCVGKGAFAVAYINGGNKDKASSACVNSSRQATLSTGSNFGKNFHVATIKVITATPDMRWTLSVRAGKKPALASRH